MGIASYTGRKKETIWFQVSCEQHSNSIGAPFWLFRNRIKNVDMCWYVLFCFFFFNFVYYFWCYDTYFDTATQKKIPQIINHTRYSDKHLLIHTSTIIIYSIQLHSQIGIKNFEEDTWQLYHHNNIWPFLFFNTRE